mmetsp:Transcript_79285/g.143048  ORF Transcript_79285/g.143048 Transcript_79285/m.143048 type:complete len:221 (-) Transcript_79285:601-1263(-)
MVVLLVLVVVQPSAGAQTAVVGWIPHEVLSMTPTSSRPRLFPLHRTPLPCDHATLWRRRSVIHGMVVGHLLLVVPRGMPLRLGLLHPLLLHSLLLSLLLWRWRLLPSPRRGRSVLLWSRDGRAAAGLGPSGAAALRLGRRPQRARQLDALKPWHTKCISGAQSPARLHGEHSLEKLHLQLWHLPHVALLQRLWTAHVRKLNAQKSRVPQEHLHVLWGQRP